MMLRMLSSILTETRSQANLCAVCSTHISVSETSCPAG
jgi:hypothetical protein